MRPRSLMRQLAVHGYGVDSILSKVKAAHRAAKIGAAIVAAFFALPAQAQNVSFRRLVTDGYELKGMSSATVNNIMQSAFWLQKDKSVYLCVLPSTLASDQIGDIALCAPLTK